jgi:hypothetical protein
MITLQALQTNGTWATRNAFTSENALVDCGAMSRADLIELAQAAARRWHTTHDAVATLRVHDTEAAHKAAVAALETSSEAIVFRPVATSHRARIAQATALVVRCEADLKRPLSLGEIRDLLADNTSWPHHVCRTIGSDVYCDRVPS